MVRDVARQHRDAGLLKYLAPSKKGSGTDCRNGPQGAAHNRCLPTVAARRPGAAGDAHPHAAEARTRLGDELLELLRHALAQAGNATLMTAELLDTLADHAAGNYRLLMTMGGELLAYGMAHEVQQFDEKMYLEVFQPQAGPRTASKKKVRT
jgi:hypothetical protein